MNKIYYIVFGISFLFAIISGTIFMIIDCITVFTFNLAIDLFLTSFALFLEALTMKILIKKIQQKRA